MDRTSNLKLPYIAPSQAQKHVTHNEAIRALDALVQLSVLSRGRQEPPPLPSEGERHIAGTPATGPWKGKDGQIAAWQDGAWTFFAPQEGWQAWIAEEQSTVVFTKAAWSAPAKGSGSVPLLGIGTVADENNRLAVKSPAVLFDHAGAGHQLKLNKAGDAQTASLLFQSNYQGQAEMGTVQGRDFRIKTSPDGTRWNEAIIVDGATGSARFPSGLVHAATGRRQASLILLAGGAAIFKPATPAATASVASVSATIVSLAKGSATAFFATALRGLVMVRIWNTTKSPAQAAFVKWDTAVDQLQVSDAAHVAKWAKDDALQIADPLTQTIAIDLSPLMQKLLGAVFMQQGVLLAADSGGDVTLACSEPSPVSASNLVVLKADDKRSLTATGLYG